MTSTLPTPEATATISMSASYFRRNGDWKTPSGEVVAHVFRDFYTKAEHLNGLRTYYLDIAPGMDMSAAVAMCLYLHERVNEWTYSGGSGGVNAYARQPVVVGRETRAIAGEKRAELSAEERAQLGGEERVELGGEKRAELGEEARAELKGAGIGVSAIT